MIIPIPLLLYLIDDAPEDNADGNGGKPPYPDRAPSNDKNHRINGQSQDHPCRVEAKGLSETMRRGGMRISVPGGSLRIYSEDRKKIKRTATQELDMAPFFWEGFGGLRGRGRRVAAVALRPFVAGRGKRLVVEVSDPEGGRQVVLRVKGRLLLRAKSG